MSCLLNDSILRDIISMSEPCHHRTIEATDPNWRSILHNIQTRKPTFNAYLSVSEDGLTYHFCDEATKNLDIHEHLESLSEKQAEKVDTLYLGDEFYWCSDLSVFRRVDAIPTGKFPQFPNLQIADHSTNTALEELNGRIPLDFQHVSISSVNLENPANDAFLIQSLRSDALKSLELDDVKLTSQIWTELCDILKSGHWENFKLRNFEFDRTRNLQMDSSILEFFEAWKKNSHPKQKSSIFGIRSSRDWCQLKEHFKRLGKEVEDDEDVVFEIPHKQKDLTAVATFTVRPQRVIKNIWDHECTELEISFKRH
ncbi:hypothetical protein L596_012924 [Steinernema carpocapsae]|uniref:F-box associated domain-containing protein n=1 Tax=Steinernema carpocapsae TaxID=34508 RepID=A0A4U5NZI4_STECR|nr:hypothetical protein L596_012924 [Steinernema carpocapsae]